MKLRNLELDKKLLNMLLFFISLDTGTTSKVGLMKFLFYSDFTFYRDYGKTISNEKYCKLPNGPCPDRWEKYLDELERDRLIKKRSKSFIKYDGSIGKGEYYELAAGVFNEDMFSPTEIKRMRKIYDVLSPYSSTKLREKSHKEVAYIEARETKEIDLKNAFFITLLENEDDEEMNIPDEALEAIGELEKEGVL